MSVLLQINVLVNSGSTGRIVEDIGLMVKGMGWESYAAYGRKGGKSGLEVIKIGNRGNTCLHGLLTRFSDRHGLGSRFATRKFLEQLEEIKPDIVHLHNIHGYYLNYPLLFEALARLDIPIVWTLHDCWAFTGHCSHYTFAGCERWKAGCYECPQRENYPASCFRDRSAQNYADKKFWFTRPRQMTIVAVSEWLAQEVRQSFLGEYPVCRIYNGVDTDLFCPRQSRSKVWERYGVRGDFLLLGVANVWDQRKGLSDFIELSRKLPSGFSLMLVGLTSGQIRTLPSGIIGIGRTENVETLSEIYAAADLFVNPSVEETFGMTTVESLACGTPAVVYRSTACPELIAPGTGFVVEPGDVDGILEKAMEVKETGKVAYSGLCRQWVLAHFSKEECYAGYLELYKELLHQSK